MTFFNIGYLHQAKDWNGWGARVRTAEGLPVQIERSFALPLQKKYEAYQLVELIKEKSEGLIDTTVELSGNGGGQGLRSNDKFLVVAGWTSDLTPAEAYEAKVLGYV